MELALILPILLMLLLALVQAALIVRDQVLVVHAAREAARQAAVDPDPDAPRRAALASSGLGPDRLELTVTGREGAGSRVRVDVRYRVPTDVPIVGAAVGDLALDGAATMRVER